MSDFNFPRAWMCLTACIVLLSGTGCRTVPMSGRQQLLLLPEDQEITAGLASYEEITAAEPPSQNAEYIAMVNRVGQRIAAVAGRPDYQWEFRVIASPQQNAFALPGGKVAIYEGIMPVCANEAGLAVVMSHEIAHALARHGGERMSHGLVENSFRKMVSYMTQSQEEERRRQIETAYGVAAKYGAILPYSRKHESEADEMGVILMAKAGYDPREAPRFWQRFAEHKHGEQLHEFLSTHPSDATRAADLEAMMPEAIAAYEASPAKFGLGVVLANPGTTMPGPTPYAGPAGNGATGLQPYGQVPATANGPNAVPQPYLR